MILSLIGEAIMGIASILKEFLSFLIPLPTAVKIFVFLILIQLIFPILNLITCPSSIQGEFLGVKVNQTLGWCYNPEILASYDSLGNPVANTGIRLFSPEMGTVWVVIFISYYILTIGLKYKEWVG